MTLNTVVIPIQPTFSIDENRSLEHGLSLAMRLNLSICLFHVLPVEVLAGVSHSSYTDWSPSEVGAISEARRKAEVKLQALRNRLQHMMKGQLQVDLAIRSGFFHEALLQFLGEGPAAMAVVDTANSSDLLSRLLGSPELEVIDRSGADFLVIPSQASAREWSRVVYLYSREVRDDYLPEVHRLADLAQAHQAEIHLIGTGNLKTDAPALRHISDHIASELDLPIQESHFLSSKDLADQLPRYLQLRQIDLLGVHHQHQSWLEKLVNGSPTRDAMRQALVPTVIFQPSHS